MIMSADEDIVTTREKLEAVILIVLFILTRQFFILSLPINRKFTSTWSIWYSTLFETAGESVRVGRQVPAEPQRGDPDALQSLRVPRR